eukprot:m.43458 g.43458  ORF g.43458 m.43458 type:complete len:76 (+) comp14733_c1_seq1:1847-2074(+)
MSSWGDPPAFIYVAMEEPTSAAMIESGFDSLAWATSRVSGSPIVRPSLQRTLSCVCRATDADVFVENPLTPRLHG